jgi:tRNA modification GTPase
VIFDVYDLNDTIVAVSSPSGGVRSILRVSGPEAISVCRQIFQPDPSCAISNLKSQISNSHIVCGHVHVTGELVLDARLYLFFAPHSYTGDDLVEIHIDASGAIVEALMQGLLAMGLRAAEPGEFTARAYLNGKLDLAQAEAVNEVIFSSNQLQLDAAERLLEGRLKQTIDTIRSELMDCLSLVEAGLDFSDGETGPIRPIEPVLTSILERLETLLAESIRCQNLVDLPAVGIAGAPNAGKSSLLNALLGRQRSIVSHEPMTTRDVLTGVLTTDRFQCVLFDCAGLLTAQSRAGTPAFAGGACPRVRRGHDLRIDDLAQQAALKALRTCEAVLFCVDAAKTEWTDEMTIRTLIRAENMVHVATKCDLLNDVDLTDKMRMLTRVFSACFLPTSARTKRGIPDLVSAIECAIRKGSASAGGSPSAVALTARHRQMVTDAIDDLRQVVIEMQSGHDEVAAMMIRAGYQALSQIEQQHIDEEILDRIFSRFCVGK